MLVDEVAVPMEGVVRSGHRWLCQSENRVLPLDGSGLTQ